MDSADNLDELALQIYDKHRTAIDLIIKSIPALEAKSREILMPAIERFSPALTPDYHSKNNLRFYSPGIDGIPELRHGSGWTRSRRILLFEIWNQAGRLELQMGPGPDETRNRICQLIQREDGVSCVDMRRARRLSSKYHPLYYKRMLTRAGSLVPEYEKYRTQVEQSISEFYRTDYWPVVNAFRKGFGLEPVSPPAN